MSQHGDAAGRGGNAPAARRRYAVLQQLSQYRLTTPVVPAMFIFSLACTFTIALKFTAITAARRPPASDTDATNDKLPLFQKCLLFYARIPAWPSMSNNSFVQWASFIELLLLHEIRREFLAIWERLKSAVLVYCASYLIKSGLHVSRF